MREQPQAKGPYQFFVSYSHKDPRMRIGRFADNIVAAAKEDGLNLLKYMDMGPMAGAWENRLTENLHKSMVFMPIVTPSYFTSAPCLWELATFASDAYRSLQPKLIVPIFWSPIEEKDRESSDFDREAEQYVRAFQGTVIDESQRTLDRGIAYDAVADIIHPYIEDIDKGNDGALDHVPQKTSKFEKHLDSYLLLTGGDPDLLDGNGRVGTARAATATQADIAHGAEEKSEMHVMNAEAGSATASRPTRKKGSQNHEGYAPAHALVVRIYNTVASQPFIEGSKERSSWVRPEFAVAGAIETISLTRDGAHPAQGLNFNLQDSAAPIVYFSANWQGVPNDGSMRSYERGNDDLGVFRILPRSNKLESYEPWEHDFDNTLANYLYRVRMSQPYAKDYIAHRDEWRARYERFAGTPDLPSAYAKELFGMNRFFSANARLEFVRDGRLLPVDQIDVEALNRTVIAVTDPAQIDEIIACITRLHNDGVRYYRVGALLDTKSDATNFVNALKAYRSFLERQ